MLRFSHYDQVVQAAIDGSGVAIGRKPHNMRHLREALLLAPLGDKARVGFGTYYALVRPQSSARQVVQEFVRRLRDERKMGGEYWRTTEHRSKTGARSAAASQRRKSR